MTTILTTTENMTRDEWLSWRNRGIGGSDIPAILGLTPQFRTAIDVWLEKTGKQTYRGESPFVVDGVEYPSEPAYWGTVHENAIATHFQTVTGYEIEKVDAILQHPNYPFILANIDRAVHTPEGNGVLELKTASAFLLDDWKDEKVPLSYQCQCQWYMAVTGDKFAFIAALIGGNKFLFTRIDRDDEFINGVMIPAAIEFWGLVDRDEMPPVDGSEVCSDLLGKMYPQSDPDTAIDLPPTFPPLIDEYDAVRAQIKELQTRQTLIENMIKQEMGANEKAWAGDRVIAWTTCERKGYEVEPSTYRRFEIKKAK